MLLITKFRLNQYRINRKLIQKINAVINSRMEIARKKGQSVCILDTLIIKLLLAGVINFEKFMNKKN